MKSKVIESAIFYPYGYPWRRGKLGISIEEINAILKENGLDSEEDRRKAGYEIDMLCYTKAIKVTDYKELKRNITEALSNKKYISEGLIEQVLSKKFLSNSEKLKAYVRFINNDMTIEEKKKFIRAIQLWIVDLFYYYKCSLNTKLDTDEIREFIVKLIKKNYKEINLNEEMIDNIRIKRSVNRPLVLNVINVVAKKFKIELEMLLEKYIEKPISKSVEPSLEDELFDIINEIPMFEVEEEEKDTLKVVEPNIEDKDIRKEEAKKEIVVEKKNKDKDVEGKAIVHLKGLAEVLGYKIVKCDDIEEANIGIDILKELTSFNKGAILSELYNTYLDFDNVSKENLEAIISNFFTSLKIQGFEVDDTRAIGEVVKVNTKDLLKDFILTSPIDEKGEIKGKIKYLPWMYNGKKITPMVVSPSKK